VESLAEGGRQELVAVSIRKGTLLATRKAIEAKAYNVKNRDQKKKLVIVEHPFRSDWSLVEPSQPTERTRDLYRFVVAVESGKGARLHVREEKQLQQSVRLMDSGPDQIAFYSQAKEVNPKVREALQKVMALRDRIGQTATRRDRLEQRVKEISAEQTRLRENMARLASNSELYNRYVGKLDQQETELEKLTKEIQALRQTEDQQKRELNDYLLGLEIG
jgi:DNA repair exonuclease SbcCD ATPase subunit